MPGGGGGTTQTTSQTQTNMGPWDVQQDYLKNAFKQADTIMSGNRGTYFPGSTVSPFNAAQNTGYNQIIDKAGNNPLFPAAQSSYLKFVNGDYLSPQSNPYLRDTFDAAAGAVSDQFKNITAPTTDALFASNGPISGGARQNAQNLNNATLGRTLNDLAANIYGANYSQGMQNQYNAVSNVGNMIQSGYLDPTAMVNAGNAQQAQSQKELTDQVNAWNAQYSQNAQWDQLAKYMSIVGGNNWGQSGTSTTTQQTPYSSNPMMQAFGGVLGAGSMAGQLGWSPFSSVQTALPMLAA
jgi:hypothetical protein